MYIKIWYLQITVRSSITYSHCHFNHHDNRYLQSHCAFLILCTGISPESFFCLVLDHHLFSRITAKQFTLMHTVLIISTNTAIQSPLSFNVLILLSVIQEQQKTWTNNMCAKKNINKEQKSAENRQIKNSLFALRSSLLVFTIKEY